MVPGHVHLQALGRLVVKEIRAEGGVPKEFNAIAVDDGIAMSHEGMTRAGGVPLHRYATYEYDMLTSDVTGKHMVPMVGHIKEHSFSPLDVHPKGRDPITLTKGDSIYFDSGLGHAYVSTSEKDATVLGVCWKPGEQRSGGTSI